MARPRRGLQAVRLHPVFWTRGIEPAECRRRREELGHDFLTADLLEAVERAPRLSRDPRLHEAGWWRAALNAYPDAEPIAEIPKAEAWLQTKGRDRKDMAAFLLNWLKKAQADADLATRADRR